jgi:hypothetical protein
VERFPKNVALSEAHSNTEGNQQEDHNSLGEVAHFDRSVEKWMSEVAHFEITHSRSDFTVSHLETTPEM